MTALSLIMGSELWEGGVGKSLQELAGAGTGGNDSRETNEKRGFARNQK